MVRHSDKPIPMPCGLVVANGWNNRAPISGAIPAPESATETITIPSRVSFVEIASSRRGSLHIASMALRSKLSRTCWI